MFAMEDLIGSTGVTLLLAAYFLNLFNKIDSGSLTYILLNFFGALLACLASVLLSYIPFVILEGIWAGVSLYSLFQYYVKK
jgi:hypothetical protein